MAQGSVADRISALVKEPVESLGLKLWDVKYVKEGASWYLRVFIDKEGGVDINNCTDVSHLLDPILDEADIIGTAYYFEVCSPGLERELTKPEHFEGFIGSPVRVILFRAVEGQKEFVGNLVSADDTVVISADSGEIVFNKQDVAKVKLADI